jgi:hypothetical protein
MSETAYGLLGVLAGVAFVLLLYVSAGAVLYGLSRLVDALVALVRRALPGARRAPR